MSPLRPRRASGRRRPLRRSVRCFGLPSLSRVAQGQRQLCTPDHRPIFFRRIMVDPHAHPIPTPLREWILEPVAVSLMPDLVDPDLYSALFRPVLKSLSRPATPAQSPLSGRSSASQSYSSSDATSLGAPANPLTAAQIDRSSSSIPAQFPPREPTDPAPTAESQGFVLYIGSLVAYALYLVWAFLPDQALVTIGIEWYPSR